MIERVRITKRDNTIVHKTIKCTACLKPYLKPCSTKEQVAKCSNYLFKIGKLKPAPAPRVERVKRIERVKRKQEKR